MNQIGTLNMWEAIWLLVTFGGIVRCVIGLLLIMKQNRARIREGINGRLKISYHGQMRMFWIGIAKFTLYFSVGVLASMLPERDSNLPLTSFQYKIANILGVWGPLVFIFGAFLLNLLFDFHIRDRQKLDKEGGKYDVDTGELCDPKGGSNV